MSQMLKSSGAMGLATLSSRILGMVREMVYAHFMGDGPVASAFKLAFQIPNLFRRLLGEGALSAAFIPMFKEKEKWAGEAEMWRAANAVISGLMVAASVIIGLVLLGVSVALIAGTPTPLSAEYAGALLPGNAAEELGRLPLSGFSDSTLLLLRLLRWMFPYMLLVCLAAVFMGMLNARGHFFIPAMSATMLNVVMIASVLFLAPRFGRALDQQIFGLAVGVLIAGIAQAAFQLPTLHREGFRFQWIAPWGNEVVRNVLEKMVPGMLGVAAFQINVLLTNGLAFWVDPQIVASFDYAVRLMELPQGVFGISLATYLLPTLSGLAAEKKYTAFCDTLRQGLGYLIFINLLASVLLVVMAEPIVRLLFERGAFDPGATRRAGLALACLAPGLVAFSTVNILARAFYALGDTKTPMQIGAVCLGLNLCFALWLVFPFRQGGLGIANTMSAIFNVYLLLYALRKKLRRLDLSALYRVVPWMFAATVLAGEVAWFGCRFWDKSFGHATLLAKIGAVFVPLGAASVAYWAVAMAVKIPQIQDMVDLVRKPPSRGKPL